jgi:hypothetical protein
LKKAHKKYVFIVSLIAIISSAMAVDKWEVIPLNQHVQSARAVTYSYSSDYGDFEESLYDLYAGLDKYGPIPELYLHMAYAYSQIEIPDAAAEYFDSFYVACADNSIPEIYRSECPAHWEFPIDTIPYAEMRNAWMDSRVYDPELTWARRWEWDVQVYLLASDAMADELLYPRNPCAAIFLLREAVERYGPIPEVFWQLSVYYTYLGFLDSALQSIDYAITTCNDSAIYDLYREPCYEYENFAVRSEIFRELILWEIRRTDFELK